MRKESKRYRNHLAILYPMSTRLLSGMVVALAVLLVAPLRAQEQESIQELRRIQAALTVINAELKADLDQILMLQEAIKSNNRTSLEAQGRSPDPVMVEDVAASQRRAIQREASINARLEAILARTAALDLKKQPLLDRVRELGGATSSSTARPETPGK
jgi:hypothetical protein